MFHSLPYIMTTKAPEFLEIGARLEALRTGMSTLNAKDWATKHRINRSRYSNWENGLRIPVEEAVRLADTYGLTLDWIYRGRRDGLSENARKVL